MGSTPSSTAPRQVARRAHQAKPAHDGARSTTAKPKRANAPAPDAAGPPQPPAPAAQKSSRTTEEARWRRHRASAGRAGAGARTRLSTDPRSTANRGENAPAAAGPGSRICTVISSPIESPRATESVFPPTSGTLSRHFWTATMHSDWRITSVTPMAASKCPLWELRPSPSTGVGTPSLTAMLITGAPAPAIAGAALDMPERSNLFRGNRAPHSV
jgi:hypothetical protein